MPMQLMIGNKNYSSWSMRPWVLMRALNLPFEEVMVRFDSFKPGSVFHQRVDAVNPAGRVPVLLDDDGFAVWDTLAITETLHERFPDAGVWPPAPRQRARARSLCAELHAGFGALRSHCPMNIEAALAKTGARLWAEHAALRSDVARIEAAWAEALNRSGGPMLFGAFSAADAFFAPVCMRLRSYGLPVSATSQAYAERVCAVPAVAQWMDEARQERNYVPKDEPYRASRDSTEA